MPCAQIVARRQIAAAVTELAPQTPRFPSFGSGSQLQHSAVTHNCSAVSLRASDGRGCGCHLAGVGAQPLRRSGAERSQLRPRMPSVAEALSGLLLLRCLTARGLTAPSHSARHRSWPCSQKRHPNARLTASAGRARWQLLNQVKSCARRDEPRCKTSTRPSIVRVHRTLPSLRPSSHHQNVLKKRHATDAMLSSVSFS